MTPKFSVSACSEQHIWPRSEISARGFGGRRSRAFGLRPIDLRPLLPAAERVNALLGRVRASSTLARSVHQPKRLVIHDFAASGSRADARLVWPPARRGIRTAAPGSCAELRLQDTALLISGAGIGEHIVRPPSSSAHIHDEPRILSPRPDRVFPRTPPARCATGPTFSTAPRAARRIALSWSGLHALGRVPEQVQDKREARRAPG
jgi:hypothetical protein